MRKIVREAMKIGFWPSRPHKNEIKAIIVFTLLILLVTLAVIFFFE